MGKTAQVIGATSVILPPIRALGKLTNDEYTTGNSGTGGLSIKYTRQGAAAVAITPASQTPGGGWISGGFCHTDAGSYRLDAPDAAFLTGVEWVEFTIAGISGVVFDTMLVELTGSPPRAAITDAVDVTKIGGSTIAGGAKMPSQVKGIDANMITDTSIASNAFTAAKFATDAVTKFRDGLLNWAIFTGFTLARVFRMLGTHVRGPTAGRGGSVETITAPDGSSVVQSTYDVNKNRVVTDTASNTP